MRGADPDLAEKLGLHPSVLDDAAALLRGGAVPKDKGRDLISIEMAIPLPLAVPFEVASAAMGGMGHGQLVRSLLHTMMQTTVEPTMRAPRRWNNGVGARVHGFGFQGKNLRPHSDKRKHYEFMLSRGLSLAVGKRAAAYGATRNRYILLWMADLADGLLGDYVFPPISTDQMFHSDSFYVLPVIGNVVDSTGAEPAPSARSVGASSK